MGEARVSKQSQDETEQQPNIGRIPALIAAVAIVGIAIGAAAGLLTLMLYQVDVSRLDTSRMRMNPARSTCLPSVVRFP